MNFLILMAILLIITYFGIAAMQSYHANRAEPDTMDEDMQPWDCPECGFHVQLGIVCIYCQTDKPEEFRKS